MSCSVASRHFFRLLIANTAVSRSDNSPLHPLCRCQVLPDRKISRLNDTDIICPASTPHAPGAGSSDDGLECNCTLANQLAGVTEEDVLTHVGQAPIFFP